MKTSPFGATQDRGYHQRLRSEYVAPDAAPSRLRHPVSASYRSGTSTGWKRASCPPCTRRSPSGSVVPVGYQRGDAMGGPAVWVVPS